MYFQISINNNTLQLINIVIAYQFMLLISLLSVIITTLGQVSPIWQRDPNVYADSVVFMSSYTVNSSISIYSSNLYSVYQINFPMTFTNAPRIAFGINSFSIDSNQSSQVVIINSLYDIQTTYYQQTLNYSSQVQSVTISYLAVDAVILPFFLIGWLSTPMSVINASGTGYRSETYQVTPAYGDVFNLSHTNGLIMWINAFTMDPGRERGESASNYQFGINSVIVNPTLYNLTFYTAGTTRVYFGGYSRLFFDLTEIQANQIDFFDYGLIQGTNSVQSSWPTILALIPNSFFFGINYFNFQYSTSDGSLMNFAQQISPPYNLSGTYLSINLTYWNYRVRNCPIASPYYYQTTQLCYTTCPNYSFPNTQYYFCYACYYACIQCNTSANINCTACDPNMYRNLSSGSCICNNGYWDNGTVLCVACNQTCLTCANASACLTCNSSLNRAFANYSCPCVMGYTSSSGTCVLCNATLTHCLSCSNTTVCTNCSSGYVVSPANNTCITCSQLSSGCLTCNSSQCLTCNTTLNLVISSGNCVCATGYTNSSGTCVACNVSLTGCTVCSSTSVCTSCNSTSNFILSSVTCTCNSTSYLSNNTCLSCSTYIPGCIACSSATVCTSCNSSLSLTVNSSKGCSCSTSGMYLNTTSGACQSCSSATVPGYYYNGSTCVACDISCYTCSSNTSTSCLSCNSNATLSGTTCICKSNSYLNTTLGCMPCDTTCLTCNGSAANNCLTCNTSIFTLSGTSCVCSSSTFYNSSTSQCQVCNTLCHTCNGSSSSNCLTCNSSYTLIGSSCICPTGKYLAADGVTCSSCNSTCSACTSASVCTVCNIPFTLNGSSCLCASGFYASGSSCAQCDVSCKTCNASGNSSCVTCNTGLTFSSNQCLCPSGTFLDSVGSCSNCDPTCQNCSGPNSNQCTTCTSPFTLISTSCSCSLGTFFQASNSSCVACDYSCLTCNGSNTNNCLTCNSSDFRTFTNYSCPCNSFYMDNGTSLCVPLVCSSGYFLNSVGICQEICGDGIVFYLPCDDGNLINGDGCSSTCTVETNYVCYGNAGTMSVCSYNNTLSIMVVCQYKDPTSNTLTIFYQISPALSQFANQNYSQIFSSSLNQNISYSYNMNGTLTAIINYNSTIQAQTANLTFTPPNTRNFLLTPPTTISYTIDPSNNIGAYYFSPSVYSQYQTGSTLASVLLYLSLAVFLISLFTGKFIGIEMIGVIQVAYIGLMTVDYIQPLLAPLMNINLINGINSLLASSKSSIVTNTVPNRVSAIQYQAQVVYDLNYMLIFLLVPVFVGLVLLALSKCIKAQQEQLKCYGYKAICQWGITFLLFSLYQYVVSSTLCFMYDKTSNTIHYISLVQVTIIAIMMIIHLVMFYKSPEHYGQYKNAFLLDNFSQNYYYVMVLERFIVAAVIAAANSNNYVAYVAMAFMIVSIVVLVIKKPYRQMRNNYRSIFNSSVVLLVLATYAYYRQSMIGTTDVQTFSVYLPYADIILLYSVVIVNALMLIKQYFQKSKDEQEYKSKLLEDQVTKQLANHAKAEEVFLKQTKEKTIEMKTMSRSFTKPKKFGPSNSINRLQIDRSPTRRSNRSTLRPQSPTPNEDKSLLKKSNRMLNESMLDGSFTVDQKSRLDAL